MKIAVLDFLMGDNGKGRWAHYFSKDADYVIRTSGAGNCGHVIWRDGKKYTHHILPSADYRNPNIKSYLGHGMYINPDELLEEILGFSKDFPGVGKTIIVDPDAFVITEAHIAEDKEKNKHIGSTNKGVGPAAISKFGRTGTRLYHLIRDKATVIEKLKELGVQFIPVLKMQEEFEKSNLVFEGSQGSAIDVSVGIDYPFVTSSDCTVSGIYSSGFHFVDLDRVYGAGKPYLTKSGNGKMITEIHGEEASALQLAGGEKGATTGRDRRIGYLDLPMSKYGIKKSGITHILMSKLDIMNGNKFIRVCNSYNKEVNSAGDFEEIEPGYIDLLGWNDGMNKEEIKPFLKYVERYCNTPIAFTSAGVNDEDVVRFGE
jgi:adenylosuccinate synthase